MLKTSVAVTAFNGEDYIEKQLISIRDQIRKPDEVVIVDDASQDSTAQIAEKFISDNNLSNWKLIVNKENLGIAMNFRKALSNVTGDIIFLCTQSDIWHEDKIESISSLLATNPNIKAVNCAHELIDSAGKDLESDYLGASGTAASRLSKTPISALLNSKPFPCGTLTVRRENAEKYIRLSKCSLKTAFELECAAVAEKGLYFYDAPLIRVRFGSDIPIPSPVESAEFQLEAAKSILSITGIEKYCIICSNRLNVLKNRSFFGIIGLYFKRDYRQLLPLKVRFNDLIYVLKSGKNKKAEA